MSLDCDLPIVATAGEDKELYKGKDLITGSILVTFVRSVICAQYEIARP